MRVKTKCRMGNLCAIRKGDGECEKNCYYNTREVKTNADRIRAMTDEELATKIEELCQYTLFQIKTYAKPNGREEWLNWLRQEVGDGNHDH